MKTPLRLLQCLFALGLCAALSACQQPGPTSEPAPSEPPEEGTPKLVLWIVVDQFRADYLDRFDAHFEGGLRRLKDEGRVYTDAHQFHAGTATAPGHATLATGNFPKHHGVIGNEWVDRATLRPLYSAADAEGARGPFNLLKPTLSDRMKEKWPEAKVFAVGGKDRSAIMTSGHSANGAFWYDRSNGDFTTSTYYPDYLARIEERSNEDWLTNFFELERLDGLFGTAWEPLLGAEDAASLGLEPLDRGAFSSSFPYPFAGRSFYPDRSFYSRIYGTPMVDDHVVAFAEALLVGEGLGQDAYPDFLGVTLSALDAVGHTYGPNAPETADTLLRVDRVLGRLLETVDREVGLDQTVILLSSDHGVSPVPEMAARNGVDAARFGAEQSLCFQATGDLVNDEFDLHGVDWLAEGLTIDQSAVEGAGADVEAVLGKIAEEIEACPRIASVWIADELAARGAQSTTEELFLNSYHPDRSSHFLVDLEPNTLSGSTIASHGTPHRYDTHVPLILKSASLTPARSSSFVRTVDAAPTVAALLGLPLEGFDGENLAQPGGPEISEEPTSLP